MDQPHHALRIEHVGIAVRDLDAAIGIYEKLLGVPCYAVEEVADQSVKTAFFRLGESKVELLQSTSPDGPVAKFIEKRGEGIHHIAYASGDIHVALRDLAADGVRLIDGSPRRPSRLRGGLRQTRRDSPGALFSRTKRRTTGRTGDR